MAPPPGDLRGGWQTADPRRAAQLQEHRRVRRLAGAALVPRRSERRRQEQLPRRAAFRRRCGPVLPRSRPARPGRDQRSAPAVRRPPQPLRDSPGHRSGGVGRPLRVHRRRPPARWVRSQAGAMRHQEGGRLPVRIRRGKRARRPEHPDAAAASHRRSPLPGERFRCRDVPAGLRRADRHGLLQPEPGCDPGSSGARSGGSAEAGRRQRRERPGPSRCGFPGDQEDGRAVPRQGRHRSRRRRQALRRSSGDDRVPAGSHRKSPSTRRRAAC